MEGSGIAPGVVHTVGEWGNASSGPRENGRGFPFCFGWVVRAWGVDSNETEPAVEICDLRVDYGDFVAVNDVSLRVRAGEICGLVGPNGAGKTSTFRVLATLLHPTYGEVRIAGHDLFEEAGVARKQLGYMPDFAPVPSDLKAWEFLDLFAHAHGWRDGRERRGRVAECLEEVHLTEKREAWCRSLSRGQMQRLCLAKTLLHGPRVMILDEPASGMDPLSRRDLRRTLQSLAARGVAVIVSSHILSELADMCSSLCVMHGGRVLASGSVESVRRELGGGVRLLQVGVREGEEERVVAVLRGHPLVESHEVRDRGRVLLRFLGAGEDQTVLLGLLLGEGIGVRSLEEEPSGFEEMLVRIAGGERGAA